MFSPYSWGFKKKKIQPNFWTKHTLWLLSKSTCVLAGMSEAQGLLPLPQMSCHTFCLLLMLSLPGLHPEQTTRITPSLWDNLWVLTSTFQTLVTSTVQHVQEWAWLSAVKWSTLSCTPITDNVNMCSLCSQQKKGHSCYCNCVQECKLWQSSSQFDLKRLGKEGTVWEWRLLGL